MVSGGFARPIEYFQIVLPKSHAAPLEQKR